MFPHQSLPIKKLPQNGSIKKTAMTLCNPPVADILLALLSLILYPALDSSSAHP
ncbi:MAG: hypothetical protein LDL14_00410 [Nitrospira sp.]|nr:hypothetical protein [Nitrospira sp.]